MRSKVPQLKLILAALAAVLQAPSTRYAKRTSLMLGAIAANLDKAGWEKLPETQRAWYVEEDGAYALDPEKIDIEDTGPLKSALEKEKQNVKAAEKARRELAELYKDVDPAKYREIMAKFDESEEGQLLKNGKYEEVFNRRTEKLKTQHQKDLEAEQTKTKAEAARADKFRDRVLENHIRAAAMKAKVSEPAVGDALRRAKEVFTLDEEGNAIQLDKDGKTVILGKDGKSPFSPLEWLEGAPEWAPHWFEVGSSGGGHRNTQGGVAGRTITRAQFMAKTPEQQAQIVKDMIQVVD